MQTHLSAHLPSIAWVSYLSYGSELGVICARDPPQARRTRAAELVLNYRLPFYCVLVCTVVRERTVRVSLTEVDSRFPSPCFTWTQPNSRCWVNLRVHTPGVTPFASRAVLHGTPRSTSPQPCRSCKNRVFIRFYVFTAGCCHYGPIDSLLHRIDVCMQ